MSLHEALQKYGLTEKETKVYLALLELGAARVTEIAKQSSIIRSTTYSILEALIKNGLVSSVEKGKVQQYLPEDPQKIIATAKERATFIEEVAPELKALYEGAYVRPKVRYYEGLQGLREMYNAETLGPGIKEYQIIASDDTWMKMDPKWLREYRKRRAKAGIKTRLILEHGPEGLKTKQEGARYLERVKLLPKNFSWKITGGVYILESKVIFVSYHGPLLAVVVHSKEIAEQQRATFEFMWGML